MIIMKSMTCEKLLSILENHCIELTQEYKRLRIERQYKGLPVVKYVPNDFISWWGDDIDDLPRVNVIAPYWSDMASNGCAVFMLEMNLPEEHDFSDENTAVASIYFTEDNNTIVGHCFGAFFGMSNLDEILTASRQIVLSEENLCGSPIDFTYKAQEVTELC